MLYSDELKMIDLLITFRDDIIEIQEERNAKLIKPANVQLQAIYKLHVSAKSSFVKIEHYLKSLYTSFNFAAVIVSDLLKKKSLDSRTLERLDECFEVMIKCCTVMIEKLKNPSAPTATKKNKK